MLTTAGVTESTMLAKPGGVARAGICSAALASARNTVAARGLTNTVAVAAPRSAATMIARRAIDFPADFPSATPDSAAMCLLEM